jgi:fructose-bisphosphate aldolase, class II
MALVPMAELLGPARAGGYAVPAFGVWNLETAECVLRTAAELRAPVILMHGPGEFALHRPARFAGVVRLLIEETSAPAALHLDHGGSMEEVRECLAAGYTSVMLDYSTRPYKENAGALCEVAALAHPLGVTVEGELGHVGRADKMTPEAEGDSTLTEPTEAAVYVEQTGVDALAISIGNAHGRYVHLPRLDFPRLAALRDAVSVPLVLHGGSGTPEEDLRQAISLGIAKVNVATELVSTTRQSLLDQWNGGRNMWAPFAMVEAMGAMGEVAARWIRCLGAAEKA